MSNDFDDYHRHSYREEVQRAISFSGQDVNFFTEVKAQLLGELAARYLGDPAGLSALDVGCGVGLTDSALEGRFASLDGVDVSEGAVSEASAANPWVRYHSYDGLELPFEDDRFDLAFAICVLHHVEPLDRPAFAREMLRVVRPGGIVVVIEHNPLNPLTRAAAGRCEFDRGVTLLHRGEVRSLFDATGLTQVGSPYILFFPWRPTVFRRIERALGWVPFGAQFMAAGRKV